MNGCTLLEFPERVNDDRHTGEFQKLLGNLPAQPRPLPGSSDDGDVHKNRIQNSESRSLNKSKNGFGLSFWILDSGS